VPDGAENRRRDVRHVNLDPRPPAFLTIRRNRVRGRGSVEGDRHGVPHWLDGRRHPNGRIQRYHDDGARPGWPRSNGSSWVRGLKLSPDWTPAQRSEVTMARPSMCCLRASTTGLVQTAAWVTRRGFMERCAVRYGDMFTNWPVSARW
jgi:hypothetical protein